MSSFNPKTIKKIKQNKKNSITIDNKHTEFINDFTKDSVNIPLLKKEIEKYKKELNNNYEI